MPARALVVSVDDLWCTSDPNLTNDKPVQAAYDFGSFWLNGAERAAGYKGYLTYYVNPRTFGITWFFRFSASLIIRSRS